MSEPSAALDGLRRRMRELTATSVVDEALALCRTHPRWFGAGLPAALAFGLVFGVAAALHQGRWAADGFEALWLGRSLPLAGLVALAWAARGLGHGAVARHLARALGHEVGGSRPVSLVLAQALATTATLVGASLALLPGLFAAGRLSVLPGLVGVEGRSLADAVRAAARSPRSAAWRGGRAGLLLVALWGVVTVNLVLGAVGLVSLLRLMTGLDTTGLGQIFDPTDPRFLTGAALTAFVLVDPVWAVVRALLFMERSEGPAGAGLERRWRAVLAGAVEPSAGPAVLLSVLLAVFAVTSSVGLASADEGRAVELRAWIDDAQDGARQLHRTADGWDGAETALVGPLTTILREQLGGPVRLPDGVLLPVDAALLLDPLPEVARDDVDLSRVRDVARALESAAEDARALLIDPAGASDPGSLLAQELAESRYVLDGPLIAPGNEGPPSLRERLRLWWEALWSNADPPPPERQGSVSKPVTPLGRIVVGVVAVLAALVVVVVLVLGVRALVAVGPSQLLLGAAPDAPSVLPDPRTRVAASWAEEAERLAGGGRYGEAIRTQYLAVLSHLDARGSIQARPGRTNGELIGGFQGPSAWLGFFVRATLGFERVHYGGHAADQQDWLGMQQESTPLLPGGRFEETP